MALQPTPFTYLKMEPVESTKRWKILHKTRGITREKEKPLAIPIIYRMKNEYVCDTASGIGLKTFSS
jgi:hypothetical protein